MRLPTLSPDKPDIDYATAKKMIASAMKAGCNYFDTAYMYHGGRSEKCLGELLQDYSRDSYYLTDKMPVWFARTPADLERIFNEQLERCKTTYFDFYLVHSLGAANWKMAKRLKAYDFLAQKKKEGKIRKLGFSFHDTPELLAEIVKAHPWDFVQLQLNYLDWELYRSREQYEIATKAGLPVIVMEPLRGGALASLSPDAVEILRKAEPGLSTASWAFRYLAGLPNVLCILSGMTLPEHVEDNIRTFSPIKPLSESDRKTLDEALAAYRKRLAVPCTSCKYCMPCPVGVEIPKIFGLYNQYKISGNKWLFSNNYSSIPEDARADACVNCGKCMKQCPQKIKIPDMLRQIAKEFA
ncbi:MAG: aldo/keto reductase [Lentisphaeria bacterium]|nr:aldo/keto reductase [Lentisphaeria bacterium]